MSSLGKKGGALKALGRKVPLKTLSQVQPVVLLRMLVGLSQILNGGAAQAEGAARALILDGQRRLRALGRAAPHLDLSLSRLLGSILSDETPDDRLPEEESAFRAVLEMCLGLMLRWIYRRDDRPQAVASSVPVECTQSFDLPWPSFPFSPLLLFRVRSCLVS